MSALDKLSAIMPAMGLKRTSSGAASACPMFMDDASFQMDSLTS